MKVKMQVIIESDGGTTEAVENIVRLKRGALRPENLGLTLAEAKDLLEGVQCTIVEQQTTKYLEQQACGPLLRKKPTPQRTSHPHVSYAARQNTVA